MKRFLLYLLFFLSFSAVSHSQDWNTAVFKLTVMPQYDLSRYNRMIIGDVAGPTGRYSQHTYDLIDELSNIVTGMDAIELVDRQHTEKLIKELKLQSKSGFVDESTIKKFGKFLGSGLILIGRIQIDDYKDQVITETSFIRVNNCSRTSYRVGTYRLHFNFKLIDIETAKVLFSKTLQSDISHETDRYDCKTPPRLNKEELYPKCVKDIGSQFKNLFYKHKKDVSVDFQSHTKFKEELKKAVAYLNVDEFNKAYQTLKSVAIAQTSAKPRSKALYNLSLLQFYSGDFQTALSTAKEGYITDSSNDACKRLLDACKEVLEAKQ